MLHSIKPFIYFLLIVVLSACNPRGKKPVGDNHFTTWQNPCFDRCASIWLMQNFVDSTATFKFIEFGKRVNEGIPFDVPGAELGRQKNMSCFESIILKYKINDPALTEIGKIVHDIDVNKWGVKVTPDADSIEGVFKGFRKQTNNDFELVDKTSGTLWEMYKNHN